MTLAQDDLWTLTWGRPQVDPVGLALAVERELAKSEADARTKVLLRDSLVGLRHHWGAERFEHWVGSSPHVESIRRLLGDNSSPKGFDFGGNRLMEPTRAETVEQFLREIGTQVRRTTRVVVGGAIALILHRLLSRATTDIDLVDEVPPELRASHELLDSLNARFGLRLTHFQSHYLPTGWASRTVTFGRFGNLDVALIDVYDSFVGKLFSRRDKDRDDLRVLYPQLDRRVLIDRVASTTAALRSDPKLLEAASHNWYVLFGEAFPGTPQSP